MLSTTDHTVEFDVPDSPFDVWFGPDAFDATYGYDVAGLLAMEPVPGPDDLETFWMGLYERALTVDPEPGLRPLYRSDTHDVSTVEFRTTDGLTIGGWFAMPREGAPRLGIVHSHGYGGRSEPDLGPIPPDAAAIFPVARGLPTASTHADLPDNSAEHVVVGIGSAHTYIIGGCAGDIWCAATALTSITGELPLAFIGGSFGGGIGALAVPWDDRFRAAALAVPTFGQHDFRLSVPCTGSGEAVRRHIDRHPEHREVLRYFDASSTAAHLAIPTIVGCALWDPSVPPPGQFAVYNAIPGEKALVIRSAGHAEYPAQPVQDEVWRQAMLTHLARHG